GSANTLAAGRRPCSRKTDRRSGGGRSGTPARSVPLMLECSAKPAHPRDHAGAGQATLLAEDRPQLRRRLIEHADELDALDAELLSKPGDPIGLGRLVGVIPDGHLGPTE